jgi:PAS domain S-box-containing protein
MAFALEGQPDMRPVADCIESGAQGNALACMPLPTFMLDREHRVVMWNPACARLTGTDAEAVLGTDRHWSAFYGSPRPMLADLLLEEVSPDTLGSHFHGTCRPLPSDGGGWQAESLVRIPSGGRWILWMASLCRGSGGEVHGAVQVAMDITERRHHEEHRNLLASIVESSEDAIIAMTNNGVVVAWNPAAARIFGYDDVEMVGRPALRLAPEEEHEALREMMARVVRGEQVDRAESLYYRKGGGQVVVSLALSPIRDTLGNVGGVSAMIRDITALKEAERQNRIRREQLMQADKMASLGALVSGVAHEINNPNHYVQMNSELIGQIWREVLPILDRHGEEHGDFDLAGLPYAEARGEMTELLAGIFDGSDKIRRIVQELRDYAREQPAESDEPVDLNAVLRSVEVLTGHMIRKNTDRFEITYCDALPMTRGSVQRIEQVVVNLLQNACQALTGRDCAIRVSTAHDRRARQVTLTVEDEGAGIPDEDLPRLADPFFTTRRESGGAGLGLAIASSIVSEHGGTIRFEPGPGRGTRVTVALPVCESPETPNL